MKNKEKYRFSDFTTDEYRRLIGLAQQRFQLRSFEDYEGAEDFVIWRHDIDHCLDCARRISALDRESGISSTFFVLLRSEYYNPLEHEFGRMVREFRSAGHRIGLHFDASFYSITDTKSLCDALESERLLFENILGCKCSAFSFHNPTAEISTFTDVLYSGLLNASAKIFRNEISYVSDSNGYWRFRRIEEVIRDRSVRRLQVLTHPLWWRDRPIAPKRRIYQCIDDKAARLKREYDERLASCGRENIDDD